MHSMNGRDSKAVVLYARVSTDEQARSGYSLAQQLEALREYTASEGFKVLGEISDPGQSGANLERPGMDRVRDLVAAGGVALVLAQDRDRLSREPAYHYLLRREFEEHGTLLRALNDRGDDSPEGELTDGILDQLAKFERAKTAERSRRGKLRKAREGKIIASCTPTYGFHYNAAREGYEVELHNMAVVGRIFEMVGAEGEGIYGVCRVLESEGIPSPAGKTVWAQPTVKDILLDDAYRPLDHRQLQSLVEEGNLKADVLAQLDPEKRYGIWWFNRAHRTDTRVSIETPDGRKYKTRSKTVKRPRNEWIAVPVHGSGISQELVDAARDAVKDNRSPSSAGRHFFNLSGGVLHCRCGRRMAGTSVYGRRLSRRYFYYECSRYRNSDRHECKAKIKRVRADILEPRIWQFVSSLLRDPDRLRSGLDAMVEKEKQSSHGDPEHEARYWLKELSELEAERSGYLRQNARGVLPDKELDENLARIENGRATAQRELEAFSNRKQLLKNLERDRDVLLESYATATPEALDTLSPEERNKVYKLLKLRVTLSDDGTPEVSGVFCNGAGLEDVFALENDVGIALYESSGRDRRHPPPLCVPKRRVRGRLLDGPHQIPAGLIFFQVGVNPDVDIAF